MSKIIDGKKISGEIKDELKEKVSKFKVKPTLVVISVGDNPASKVYVGQKEKAANYIGLNYEHMHFDSITDDNLIKEIEKLNTDHKVNGIIVQVPLPDGMNECLNFPATHLKFLKNHHLWVAKHFPSNLILFYIHQILVYF